MNGGDPTTNYQLMPNDRIIVYRDPIVRFTVFLDRMVAPFQTVISSTLQTSFMIRYLQILKTPVAAAGAGGARAPITNLPLEPGAR
jgi:polysaccharide export outer membrane protein